MRVLQNSSLIKKFTILFAFTIIVTLSGTIIFYILTYNSLKSEKYKYIESTASNLMQNTEDISSAIMMMAESISNSSVTQSFLVETDADRKMSYRQEVKRLINRMKKYSDYISTILILDKEGDYYSFSNSESFAISKLVRQYDVLALDAYDDGFTDALFLPDTDTAYYVYFRTIYGEKDGTNEDKLGTCVIICSGESLKKVCRNAAAMEDFYCAILDSDNQIIASSSEAGEINEKKHLTLRYDSLPMTGWQVFCAVPYSALYSELNFIRYFAVLFVFLMILVFLFLVWQINSSIIYPLIKINAFLGMDSYGILHSRLEIKNRDEIASLSTHINQMLDNINLLNHKVLQTQAHLYEMEISKTQAQLLALQTQINPHFLNNTLNSVQGLAVQGKCEEICTVMGSLAYLMRYNVKGDNTTFVKDEFLCIKKYLEIIEIRYPNRFRFQLDMDEAAGDCEMPRFLLQPLVENAVFHGLEPVSKKGNLILSVSLQEDSILHFECRDNGVGIPADKLEKIKQEMDNAASGSVLQDSARIGILNIHLRIQLLYGTDYGLSIQSGPEGTTVCADFPSRVKKV